MVGSESGRTTTIRLRWVHVAYGPDRVVLPNLLRAPHQLLEKLSSLQQANKLTMVLAIVAAQSGSWCGVVMQSSHRASTRSSVPNGTGSSEHPFERHVPTPSPSDSIRRHDPPRASRPDADLSTALARNHPCGVRRSLQPPSLPPLARVDVVTADVPASSFVSRCDVTAKFGPTRQAPPRVRNGCVNP